MLSRMSLSALSKVASKSQSINKNHTTNRSLHLICKNRIPVTNIPKHRIVVGHYFFRQASTETLDIFQIPTAPAVPTIINEPQVLTEIVSEVTKAGLGTSWNPVSLVQHTLEFLHASVGLPWWGAIVAVTIVSRLACFPLVIKGQKNAQEMSVYMPKIQEIQKKLVRARKAGDEIAVKKYSMELSSVMMGKELDPLKSLYPQIIQGSIAVSLFLALDRMTRAPIESMKEGGLFWFTNLCVTDPYWILPLMSSSTLMLLMMGASEMMPMPETTKKILVFALPCITFLFVKSFSAGTLIYWITTNSVTLCQHKILKLPQAKEYFGLKNLPVPKKNSSSNSTGFLETFRENMDNIKVSQQVRERFALQDIERRRSAINGKFEKALKIKDSQAVGKK